MDYSYFNSVWWVWCFGVVGCGLALGLLIRKARGPRFGRWIAALSAAFLVALGVGCWFVALRAGVDRDPRNSLGNLDREESAGKIERRSQAEEYLDRQIVDVAQRFQARPLDAGGAPEEAFESEDDRAHADLPEADPFSPAEMGASTHPSVGVFDAGVLPSVSLLAHASTDKTGWTRIPEDTTPRLDGDAVLANDRMAIIFRRGGSGAEVYGRGADGIALRAVLTPLADDVAGRLQAVALVENSGDQSTLDATFRTADGQDAAIRFELAAGQAFVKTTARRGATHLRIEAPCRFAVLPDFFSDDIVVDAESLPGDKAALPSENLLMHMVGNGEAIVLAVWSRRDEDVQVALATRNQARNIRASEISYGSEGAVFVSVLEGHGIWHHREIKEADAGRTVRLDWKAPFLAQWRVDWRRRDGLTDSWQMFVEKPDGNYVKLDWFGQPEEDGTPAWLKSGRKRWTPALGSFEYPCWIDRNSQGWFQPLADKELAFQGPALVYPLHRAPATPLAALTIVDLMRATLGVGPCEYVLDVEGQKGKMVGVPTCVTREKLMAIYAKKEQKKRRAEVEQALDDVLRFVWHIRTRIETYAVFGQRTLAYLGEEEKARPDLAGFVGDMKTIVGTIDAAIAAQKIGLHSPEYATQLVEQFRATLLDYEGDDAALRCSQLTIGLTEIGYNQDRLVGKCREAVKVLRERAALAMAVDSRNAPVAEEIRRLTQAMLRNPTSFEAPRH